MSSGGAPAPAAAQGRRLTGTTHPDQGGVDPRCPCCLRPITTATASLTVEHGLACPLLDPEATTAATDRAALADLRAAGLPARLHRPATDAERALVAACGTVLPADALTVVRATSATTTRRTWTGLTLDDPEPSATPRPARGDTW